MTFNTLPASVRKSSAEALQPLLASSNYLYAVTRHAHWNVKDPNFIGIHQLLGDVYGEIEGWADRIAERIRALGFSADGSPEAMISGHQIEFPEVESQTQYVKMVGSGLGILSKLYREAISDKDPGTANLLQDLTMKADHQIFLLESHLS